MLGSVDPILIFQIYKNVDETTTTNAKIPLTSTVKKRVTVAVIPVYLSEDITGIYIDTESKNIDIETNMDSLSSGEGALVNQKTIGSTTSVNLIAKQGSLALTILLSLAEMILDKVTSQEYEVTYMHGAITVFGGLVHGFSVDQGSNDDLYHIKLELTRGRPKSKSVVVGEDPTAERLGTAGATPPANAPTFSGTSGGGVSQIQPKITQPGLN